MLPCHHVAREQASGVYRQQYQYFVESRYQFCISDKVSVLCRKWVIDGEQDSRY